MKVFFILIIFSFMLAMCQGHCIMSAMLATYKDGKLVKPTTCPSGGKRHLIGSVWYTELGLRCQCNPSESICCEMSDVTEGPTALPPNL